MAAFQTDVAALACVWMRSGSSEQLLQLLLCIATICTERTRAERANKGRQCVCACVCAQSAVLEFAPRCFHPERKSTSKHSASSASSSLSEGWEDER